MPTAFFFIRIPSLRRLRADSRLRRLSLAANVAAFSEHKRWATQF